METFYYIYKITNLINGKIYVGVHKTKDLNDGYMGSGKVIRRAIEKHGIDNFKKDILETFENAEAMYAREKEIVTDEFLLREDVYNLRRGGNGGWDYINGLLESKEYKIKGGKSADSNLRTSNIKNKFGVDYFINWSINGNLTNKKNSTGFYDKKVREKGCLAASSEEANSKRIETFKQINHQQGSKNSQYGTCWIWHELIGNKKINKESLPLYIDQGWSKGRKYNGGVAKRLTVLNAESEKLPTS